MIGLSKPTREAPSLVLPKGKTPFFQSLLLATTITREDQESLLVIRWDASQREHGFKRQLNCEIAFEEENSNSSFRIRRQIDVGSQGALMQGVSAHLDTQRTFGTLFRGEHEVSWDLSLQDIALVPYGVPGSPGRMFTRSAGQSASGFFVLDNEMHELRNMPFLIVGMTPTRRVRDFSFFTSPTMHDGPSSFSMEGFYSKNQSILLSGRYQILLDGVPFRFDRFVDLRKVRDEVGEESWTFRLENQSTRFEGVLKFCHRKPIHSEIENTDSEILSFQTIPFCDLTVRVFKKDRLSNTFHSQSVTCFQMI